VLTPLSNYKRNALKLHQFLAIAEKVAGKLRVSSEFPVP
jgi:hypothetical protein